MFIAENITKKFPGVTALHEVSMQLHPGKVNAIVGENGAGKSTLMKIFSGVYPNYDGQILLNNKVVNFANPREAQHAGIGIIHQELNLIPHLSITENIFLGREIANSWGMLDRKAMKVRTQQLLDKLKLKVSPDTLIYDLKVGQQQLVEIAKALLNDCSVLIMDEPTSAISESEVEILFGIIEELKRENKIIVYISHKLNELFKIADHYIVLRDGKVIENGEMKAINHDLLIQKMVGREIDIIRNKGFKTDKAPLLSVKNQNLSFHLYPGEVLGIFGLMGAGRTELLEIIFGLHKNEKKSHISINQKEVNFTSPAAAMQAGIALVPEDRKKDGLVLGLDVKANIAITMLNDLQNMGILSSNKEQKLAKKYIDSLSIKTPSASQLVKNLSGGNQQKIVLAKCLATSPLILMLDEPTRGIDINAKNEIYKLIMEFAAKGMGIIMVSSELPEILAIADRVLVMADGSITAEFTTEIARKLKGNRHVTVITNALNIAMMLGAEPGIEVIMTGGEFKPPTLSLTGQKAADFFKGINIQKLFLATAGLSLKSGLTYPSISDIVVKKAMIDAAETTYLVADSTKFGKSAFASLGALSLINYIITDGGIEEKHREVFRSHEIEIIVAT